MAGAPGAVPVFEPASSFQGARPGSVFKLGDLGLGYYLDPSQTLLPKVRPQLPERWRDARSLREERLRVDPAAGAGLTLAHSEFGFLIENVAPAPCQGVRPGEVIVAIEGRVLAGLSAPQMQASFLKRRSDGARLHVAQPAELRELNQRDPSIVECWDAANQRHYYFHKKTGRSGWTLEELQQPAAGPEAAASASAAPVDLANFLLHGFAKPKEPPKKKAKVAQPKAGSPEKDESDLAREERQRWKDWNDGGRGGYTEAFLDKYKNCQSNPAEPKPDKRLKGSVGPGQGMEYMGRWTGSKNSFN